jgi:hypothetical protein
MPGQRKPPSVLPQACLPTLARRVDFVSLPGCVCWSVSTCIGDDAWLGTTILRGAVAHRRTRWRTAAHGGAPPHTVAHRRTLHIYQQKVRLLTFSMLAVCAPVAAFPCEIPARLTLRRGLGWIGPPPPLNA